MMFDYNKLSALFATPLPLSPSGKHLVTAVPRSSAHAMLWNVRVLPLRKGEPVKLRLPEDSCYETYPELYSMIGRICVVLQRPEDDSYVFVANSLPKFNALTAVDDDDAALEDTYWAAYEKANGHTFFCTIIPGDVMVFGTKGCAWALALADFTKDAPQKEAQFPSAMVRELYVLLCELRSQDPAQFDAVARDRVLVGEVETNQHIRYYPAPGLMFFDVDLPPMFRQPEALGPLLPEQLTTSLFRTLRSGDNNEGYVVAALSADGKVLRRYKVKTLFYILMRMVRQAYTPDKLSLDDMLDRVQSLAFARNNAFIHVAPAYVQHVVNTILHPLVEYMYAAGVKREDISFASQGFAPVLQAFRETTGVSTAMTIPDEPFKVYVPPKRGVKPRAAGPAGPATGAGAGAGPGSGTPHLGRAPTMPVIVTTCMGPGLGKTTLMRAVAEKLRVIGAEDISQDDFPKAGDAFYRRVEELAAMNKPVCIHRCCFKPGDRAHLLASLRRAPLLLLEPASDTDDLHLLYAQLRGVLADDRSDHATLGAKVPVETKVCVAASMWSAACRVSHAEVADSVHCEVVPLDIIEPSVELPRALLDAVADIATVFEGNKPFGAVKTLPPSALAALDVIKRGPEIRRPVHALVRDVIAAYQRFAQRSHSPPLYISVDVPAARNPLHGLAARLVFGSESGVPAGYKRGNHVTLTYGPSPEEVEAWAPLDGQPVQLSFVEVVSRLDGALVTCPATICDRRVKTTDGRQPHFTVFWDPRVVAPKESNALLAAPDSEKRSQFLDAPVTVVGFVTAHASIRVPRVP